VTLAERLKELMAEYKPPMTQPTLAFLADVTQPAVNGWLNGATPYPKTISKLCGIFGVRRDWLMYGEGKKHLPKSALRKTLREDEAEYGALLKKVTFIEQSGDAELISQVDAFLDLACQQLGVRRDKKPRRGGQ
jgi:transcriptional regulator with XRE-family HTH domain